MSRQPIARNADLLRLEAEGYALEIDVEGYLLVKHVPYVTRTLKVKRGSIVVKLVTRGTIDDIEKFKDHTVYFTGELPCDECGQPLTKVVINSERRQLGTRIWIDHQFSRKPISGAYTSMYAQIKQYATILESYAQRIEREVTARIGPNTVSAHEDQSPFVYADTASVRAEIVPVTAKLKRQRVAIVGVGGTGSYVLDLVAKTPVAEIHLFDDDDFFTHNAFRGPGAATLEDLRSGKLKVHYWKDEYSAMHKGIVDHPYRISAPNVSELISFDFVFICMDSGPDKLVIVNALEESGTSFIDTGIGLQEVSGALRGTVRTTTSTSKKREHVRNRVSFEAPREDNEYERNIQVADLNALNAAFAVVKWKKLFGFYHDFEYEHESTYTINSHLLTREDRHDPSNETGPDPL